MNFNHWVFKFWPLSKYDAITLPWGVYFKDPVHRVSGRLINHESVHLAQIEKHGVFGFYSQYLWEYVCNLFRFNGHDWAYRNISFEKEAYRLEGGK